MPCTPHLLETGCGTTQETSSFESGRRAAAQAVSTITTLSLSVVMVFASLRHDLEEALRGVRSVTGVAPLIGVATAGELCNGLSKEGISVTVLASPHVHIRYAVAGEATTQWRAAVEMVVGDPGLAPYFSPGGELVPKLARQGKSLFGVVFFPGGSQTVPSPFHEILEFLTQHSLGRIPFFSSVATRDPERTHILAGDHGVADALLVALFETDLRFGIATPVEIPGMCTLLNGFPLADLCRVHRQGGDGGVSSTLILGRELSREAHFSRENDRLRRELQESAALLSAERFVRSTLDTFPAEICVLDENGIIMATNKSWRDFARENGLLPQQANEGDNYLAVCDPSQELPGNDAAEFGRGICRVIQGELTEFRQEYSCHSPTLRRWYLGTVVKLQGVMPTRVMIVHENITHLKLTEDSLRESRDNYRLFFETMDDLIFIGTPEGLILYTNPAVLRKLGYSSEELLTLRFLDLHADSCRGEAEEILGEILRGERSRCSLPLRKQDGSLLPVETRIWRGRWDGQEVIYGICKDQSSLHAVLDMFQKIFEHNPSPLALSLADTGEYVRVNEAFQKTVGYCSLELLGRTSGELGLFTDPELQQEASRRLLETGTLEGCELSLRTKSGELRTGIFSGAVISTSGVKLFLTVLSDITERKLFEEELLLSRSLAEAANRAKSAFLATMSHELRTPLNSILGMCEVLGEEVCGVVTEEQRHYLTVIDESGRHLLALINDILDLSRIEADKLEPELGPFDLEDLCRSSLTFIREAALKKRIAVSMILKHTPGRFVSDQRRLKQILINLLGNAVKFTLEGGEVGLEVEGDPERGALSFTVRDAGIGIAADDLKKLFQPFVQVDSSLARRYEGTGLGLTLVARLAELLGGGGAVASEPGKGSRFTVTLPWSDGEAEPEMPPPHEPFPPAAPLFGDPGEAPLILLAEDNRASCEMISISLRTKGYRVITCENGLESVMLAKEQLPDLILMDVQMPVLDGLSAIQVIRGLPLAVSSVPIIALTALAMPGDKECCLEAGADAYLDKPISLRKLTEQIRVMLEEGARF